MASWNAQALFAADPQRQHAKQIHLTILTANHDAILIQETHATTGTLAVWSPPPGTRLYSSNGTAKQAGVAILVTESFLGRFDPISKENEHRHWRHLEQGRVAKLKLTGPEGNLDLMVVYLQSGQHKADREHSRRQMMANITGRDKALTIIGGDFNYAPDATARAYIHSEVDNQEENRQKEEREFQDTVLRMNGMYEAEQNEYTHHHSGSFARLDRWYLNAHVSEQLDRQLVCYVQAWAGHLSDHRTVVLKRASAKQEGAKKVTIPLAPAKHKDWQRRVHRHWHQLTVEDEHGDVAMRRLVLLQKAIAEVSQKMQSEAGPSPPSTLEEKLSITMACVRATEGFRWGVARKLAEQYPAITGLIEWEAPFPHAQRGLWAMKEHALELYRESLLEELKVTQKEEEEAQVRNEPRRAQLAAKIAKIRPGAAGAIKAIQDGQGRIRDDTAGIAATLKEHWQETFKHKYIDEAKLEDWLKAHVDEENKIQSDPTKWEIRRHDVQRAIKFSGCSSPGPDGISYGHWKALGTTAVGAIHEALAELSGDNPDDILKKAYKEHGLDVPHTFNLSHLVCIPKTPHTKTDTGMDVYLPSSTRPLSVVNTVNRLMASSARLRWEPRLAPWISECQRGFVRGRSLLQNVWEMEQVAMRTALEQQEGMIMLFDFAAAFPSMANKFIEKSLRHVGLPGSAMTIVDALYSQNRCLIAIGGATFEGFGMESGVRQGCPLSPLLYVTAADSLLRALKKALQHGHRWGYADDTSLVTHDWKTELPKIQSTFKDFEEVSGLALNIAKTHLIPLGDKAPADIQQELEMEGNTWASCSFTDWSTYLGFAIGPGKQEHSWDKPLKKLQQRTEFWDWSKLGLQGAAVYFNVFVLPVLLFVAQLEDPPPKVLAAIRRVLVKASPGAAKWCTEDDLHHMHQEFGSKFAFRSLGCTAAAAKIRVGWWEAGSGGGLRAHEAEQSLQTAVRNSEHVGRCARWRTWFNGSFSGSICRAEERLRAAGTSSRRLVERLGKCQPHPWPQDVMEKAKKATQGAAYKMLNTKPQGWAEERVRTKLKVWRLTGFPRVLARDATARLKLIGNRTPPRVHAAVWSTLFGRWLTARRMGKWDSCRFQCGVGSCDVTHYMACPILRRFAADNLDLQVSGAEARQVFTLTEHPAAHHGQADAWIKVALAIFVAYRTFNATRHAAHLSEYETRRALSQALVEATRGDPALMQLVSRARCKRWSGVAPQTEVGEEHPPPRTRRRLL